MVLDLPGRIEVPGIAGSLAEGTLPAALREIYVGRRSGALRFTRERESLSVHFVKGHIFHGESGPEETHLGEIMVAQGLLSAADRERAAAIVLSTRKRMGSVLVGMGLLDHDQLRDVLALHVREILLRVFSWSQGTFAFDESDQAPGAEIDLTLKLSTGEMILEAVRRLTNPEAIRRGLGDLSRRLVLATDPLLRFQRVTLTPADGFLLSRVDGHSSALEILKLVPLPVEEVEQSLFGLLCTGLVDYLAPPPPEPVPPPEELRQEVLAASHDLGGRTHYEVLGVQSYAPESTIEAAYHRMARRYHPDLHHHPELADLRDRFESLFIRVRSAYETLRNPQARAAYEEQLARVNRPAPAPAVPPLDHEEEERRLERIYQTAEGRFAERKFWEVVGLLEALVPLASGRLQQKARILLARTYFKNPHWRRQAEAELLAVLGADAENVEARLALAEMHRNRGQVEKAVDGFRDVLRLRPRHKEATAALAALTARTSGGFLKRILGR